MEKLYDTIPTAFFNLKCSEGDVDPQKIEALKKIVEKDPNALLAHFGLGQEYLKAGMHEAAAHHLREAIRIKPDYTAAFRFLGQALEKWGRIDEAKQVYREGIAVAERVKDIEAGKVMAVFLKRLESALK